MVRVQYFLPSEAFGNWFSILIHVDLTDKHRVYFLRLINSFLAHIQILYEWCETCGPFETWLGPN